MNISIYQLIIVILFVGLTFFIVIKGGIKLKEGSFEDVAPFALLEVGIFLITAGVFSIDSSLVAMYAISGEKQQLSIIDYISNQQTEFSLIGIGVLLCIISCFMYKGLSKDRAERLLNIQAYDDNRLEYLSVRKCNGKIIEGQYIDLTELWKEAKGKKSSSPDFKKNIERMVKLINEKINLFKASSSKYKRSFTGIAPIPLLIYAGKIIPKLGFSRYLEIQKLGNENELVPLDTSGKVEYPSLQISSNITTSDGDEEVVVAVSTTQKISDNDLKQFIDKGLQVKHIYLENPSHTSIVSVSQINNYAETIIKEILDIKIAKANLKTVHLVCSSKPSLMFRLGQLIDDTQMPVVISYHYTQQDDYKYPWGLYINHCKKEGELFLWR
jgi:hypothetical protein